MTRVMVRRRTVVSGVLVPVLVLVLSALACLVAPPPATASGIASAPAAAGYYGVPGQVHISSQAYEGPRGTIFADIRAWCAPTYVVTGVLLDFSQGDVTTPTMQAQPFPCDGRWHAQRVSSLEAFDAGPATLTVTLLLADKVTGAPAPPIVATKSIYVRPAAKVVLPRTGHLLPDGRVELTVWARCDAPWVLQEFHVTLTQGEFPDPVASDDAYLDLACDGVLRPVTLVLASEPVSFHRGAARLEGTISLLDPEQFDPVTQVTTTRTVWLS